MALVSKYVCEDTGSLLMDYQLLYGYDYGGQSIQFDKPLLNKVKFMTSPEIVLLGFKPRSLLKEYHNIKHSSFIYPDEQYVKGVCVCV